MQSGNAEELPTSQVMEKQKVLLEELRHKLDLDLEQVRFLVILDDQSWASMMIPSLSVRRSLLINLTILLNFLSDEIALTALFAIIDGSCLHGNFNFILGGCRDSWTRWR